MRRIYVLFFTILSSFQLFAQNDVVERMVNVRKLLSEVKPSAALSQLRQIEKECLSSDNDTLKAVYLELRGQALHDMGRYEECIPFCKESISLFERCNLRQYEYLDAFSIIAKSYYFLCDYNNAESYYRKGLLRSVSANVSSTDQYRADIYHNLGNLYKEKGDENLANECFEKSKQLQKDEIIDVSKWKYLEWENSYYEKIDGLTQSEKYQEAIDVYSEMIPGILKMQGKSQSYLLAVYSKAILLSRYLGKFDDALPLYVEVIESGKSKFPNNENVCGAYCNMVMCYAYSGNFSKVDSNILEGKEYLSYAKNDYYPPHSIYRFAGNGAYWTQNYEKAIKYYETYLSPQNKREIGNSYDDITNQLSVSYIFANKPKKAEQLLKGFLKTEERRLKTDNPSTLANIFHNLGRAVMLGGNKSEALKYLNRSKDLQMNIYSEVSERTLQYINECNAK